jgi:DNA primase
MTENLVLALDADEAGIKAAGRAARAALQGGLNVKVARLPHGKDPADLILEDAEAWRAAIRESKDIITFLLDVLEEHAKSPDVFRRSVEHVVLPFLTDVQSPIAREQYIREIAKRLHVSESAVSEAFGAVPRMPGQSAAATAKSAPQVKAEAPAEREERARHAYAILVSQESMPKPSIDVAAYRKDLQEVLGADTFAFYEKLGPSELEALRFSAEALSSSDIPVGKEASTLLAILRADKLSREMRALTEALQRAEAAGDEGEVERLMKQSKLLTGEIAKLHEKR